jgi:TPR repeat protein
MAKLEPPSKISRQRKLDLLFRRAYEKEEEGSLRSAFRLYLAGAKAGDSRCQISVGNCYSDGIGIKPNRALAVYWYRRAYRHGERCAAHNIGIVYRDELKFALALRWFERAVALSDGDANLQIAKIYLQRDDLPKAVHYLEQVLNATVEDVTEASKDKAKSLLKRLAAQKRKRKDENG